MWQFIGTWGVRYLAGVGALAVTAVAADRVRHAIAEAREGHPGNCTLRVGEAIASPVIAPLSLARDIFDTLTGRATGVSERDLAALRAEMLEQQTAAIATALAKAAEAKKEEKKAS